MPPGSRVTAWWVPEVRIGQPCTAWLLAALLGLALPAQAVDIPTPAQAAVETTGGYLARMDSDGDGRVSLAEYQGWMGYAFSRMDANGDGVLSSDELPGGRGRPVSLTAHQAQIAQRFARQDRNGDGWLSARELAAPPQ